MNAWFRHRWFWHPDRPWWRRILAFPFGPCWHVDHGELECEATWGRHFPGDDPTAGLR